MSKSTISRKCQILLKKAMLLHKKGYHGQAYRLQQEANSLWKIL